MYNTVLAAPASHFAFWLFLCCDASVSNCNDLDINTLRCLLLPQNRFRSNSLSSERHRKECYLLLKSRLFGIRTETKAFYVLSAYLKPELEGFAPQPPEAMRETQQSKTVFSHICSSGWLFVAGLQGDWGSGTLCNESGRIHVLNYLYPLHCTKSLQYLNMRADMVVLLGGDMQRGYQLGLWL